MSEGVTLAGVLTSLGTVATAVIGYAGDAAGFIVSQPLTLIPLGVFILGAGFGIVKRAVSV